MQDLDAGQVNVRKEVNDFVVMAPLPDSRSADQEQMERLTDALLRITAPVSREEAVLLASTFGPDECFGLAWTLVHLIDSAPGGAPVDRLPRSDDEWIEFLRQRATRVAPRRE